MIKLTKSEQRQIDDDVATLEERGWLDRLERVRPDLNRVFIAAGDRDPDGRFRTITKLFKHRRLFGSAFGAICVDLNWVKKEVKRHERQLVNERIRESRNCVGAGI